MHYQCHWSTRHCPICHRHCLFSRLRKARVKWASCMYICVPGHVTAQSPLWQFCDLNWPCLPHGVTDAYHSALGDLVPLRFPQRMWQRHTLILLSIHSGTWLFSEFTGFRSMWALNFHFCVVSWICFTGSKAWAEQRVWIWCIQTPTRRVLAQQLNEGWVEVCIEAPWSNAGVRHLWTVAMVAQYQAVAWNHFPWSCENPRRLMSSVAQRQLWASLPTLPSPRFFVPFGMRLSLWQDPLDDIPTSTPLINLSSTGTPIYQSSSCLYPSLVDRKSLYHILGCLLWRSKYPIVHATFRQGNAWMWVW
jgi:hypothetical protein